MNLEQQLKATAEQWLAEECLSPQRSAQLEELVRGMARRRRLAKIGLTAGAAAVVALGVNWPMVISVASDTPLVGAFVSRLASRDQGAFWAQEKGFVVPVDKSANEKGYIFRVESVAADASRTIVYFTIEGPDLSRSAAPVIEINATFNRLPAPFDGYGSMQWDIVDGRLVGQVNLAPLPHPTALLGITASHVNGVKGDWHVSFMASRTKLDQLTRTVAVDQHLRGDGYDLVVHSVLLAPTETRVEMTGMAAENFELRGIELLADGKPVASHGGSYGGILNSTSTDVHPMKFDLPFERVDGNPKNLTLRLRRVQRWRDGGPVIDLTRPATKVDYAGVTFELDAIRVADGMTEIALRVPGDQSLRDKAWAAFREWRLVDGSGREYQVKRAAGASAEEPMRFFFEAEVNTPVRLEARHHTEPASGTVEVSIPLK